MTPAEYRTLRRIIGTQTEAADVLGVHRVTIAGRERGDPRYPISREAALAIEAAAVLRGRPPKRRATPPA